MSYVWQQSAVCRLRCDNTKRMHYSMLSIVLRNICWHPTWGEQRIIFPLVILSIVMCFILFFPTNLPFHFNVKQCFVSRVNFCLFNSIQSNGVCTFFLCFDFFSLILLPHAMLLTSSRSHIRWICLSIISKRKK